jgi:hypothetical protein
MTEDASSGTPSPKTTPARSANVHDAPSFVICHDEASAGVIRDVAGSTSTSVSKIWRVAISDSLLRPGRRRGGARRRHLAGDAEDERERQDGRATHDA